MTKALTVLAECVDARNGKRFQRGDVFDPVPTADQVGRLIAAGCLSEAARELAEKADIADEDKAAAEKEKRDNEAAAAKLLIKARADKDKADRALEEAQASLARAKSDADKSKAQKAVDVAAEKVEAASNALAELTK